MIGFTGKLVKSGKGSGGGGVLQPRESNSEVKIPIWSKFELDQDSLPVQMSYTLYEVLIKTASAIAITMPKIRF